MTASMTAYVTVGLGPTPVAPEPALLKHLIPTGVAASEVIPKVIVSVVWLASPLRSPTVAPALPPHWGPAAWILAVHLTRQSEGLPTGSGKFAVTTTCAVTKY